MTLEVIAITFAVSFFASQLANWIFARLTRK